MSVIDVIQTKLQRFPHLRYQRTATSIEIFPETPDGFPVRLYVDGNSFTVGFGGWHDHYGTEDEALDCFAWGLSDECRLRVNSRGKAECRWTVQRLADGVWYDESETGLLFFPFWRRSTERFYQNQVIRSSSSGTP